MKQQASATIETCSKGRKMVDFTGKTIFVGIDVHKKDWQVGFFYSGLILGNHRIAGNIKALLEFLAKHYPGANYQCVYECCAWGFNLKRQLTKAGIECIVVHAADVPSSDKEKKNKCDRVDAARLARHYASGLLDAIYVPGEQQQKERNLIRLRKRFVGDLTRTKNRLKGLLKFQGIDIPEQFDICCWSKNFIKWVEQQVQEDPILKDTVELLVDEIKFQKQLLLKCERRLRLLMKTERYSSSYKLLQSVVGVGPTLAQLFLLEIGDIKRFPNFDCLNSLVGFYPGSHSSGDKDQNTGITHRKHNQLRSMMIEASWKAIKRDPALLQAYEQLTKRMKGTEAIIRIARRLLRRMRSVLLTGQQYQIGVVR